MTRPLTIADRADLRRLVHILAELLGCVPRPPSPIRADMKKRCRRCRRLLPLTEFHRDTHSKNGHYPHCRRCVKRAKAGVS